MSYSATRLTCFALLAAMELDMRDAIESHLGDTPIDRALPNHRADKAQARRQKDGIGPATSLPALLPYLDFGESYELLQRYSTSLPIDLRQSVSGMAPNVEKIVAIRNRVAHTRPMEIDDSAVLLDVVTALSGSDPSHWSAVKDTIDRLTSDPSYVLGLTINLPTDPDKAPQHNLPIPDFDETGFFGRRSELQRIKKAVKGAYPVISILGDGGIGKTSIALKVAYELLEDPSRLFEAFVWVTAKATILTTNEIRRINGAIESSLGLFARAADELGGPSAVDPVEEVLAYMENFRVLLILDNLETVLDSRLRDFLLDLPMGSKVIITSRIGLGIENPVQLAPLSEDDSAKLLRALARIRNVTTLADLDQATILKLARQMAGHPAYIRWFVAGVQSGRRPEDLIGNNELLLDFCMSNVYKYLTDDARAGVRCMQVLPGGRNQAELAFLNEFSAATTQATLLELLRTNFVQMSSQSTGQALDTVYQLSEFAKQYVDKHHPVQPDERAWLLNRSQELTDLGFQFTVESSASPYSANTVFVRGLGDVHASRLLRDALQYASSDPASGLALCEEAQILAPAYYEGWRVEGHLHAVNNDHGSALAAFERALELAPESPVLAFHFGCYLLNQSGEPSRGLKVLQSGARLDPHSPELSGQIAWAHFQLGDMMSSVDSSQHVILMRQSAADEKAAACIVALRAGTAGIGSFLHFLEYDNAGEMIEAIVELVERVDSRYLDGECCDRLLQLRVQARELAEMADGYTSAKAAEYDQRMVIVQQQIDPSSLDRRVAAIKRIVIDKRFGFIRDRETDFFFHYRDLIDRHDWEHLVDGSICAFNPIPHHARGPRAERVRLLT